MSLTRSERERLIQQYIDGPARLEGALARVPAEARKWRMPCSLVVRNPARVASRL